MNLRRDGKAYEAFLDIVDNMQMGEDPIHLQVAIDVLRGEGVTKVAVVRLIQECVDAGLLWFDNTVPHMVYVNEKARGPGQQMTSNDVQLFLTREGFEEYTYVRKGVVELKRLTKHMRI